MMQFALLLSGILASTAVASPATLSTSCCLTISRLLPSVYYPTTSDNYTALVEDRWSKTAVLRPGCVITPRSTAEVSKSIKVLAEQNCRFAVKSGGHNANPGANSIDDGVSIDLRNLNAHSLAEDKSYVTLGTGLNWKNAYAAFQDSKIGFTGGICEDVGVGGLAVGGGQSLFQASKGWVVDNILRYEVVLASGQVVNATQSEHQRLFKALKGGNTNLGIVTSVDLAAFELDKIWAGQVLLLLNGGRENTRDQMVDKLSRATVDFIDNNANDVASGLQVITSYLRDGSQIVDLAVSNTDNVVDAPALRSFLSMPNQFMNTTRHATIGEIAHETSEAVPRGFRYVTASLTISNDLETLRDVWAASDAVYNSLAVQKKVDWLVSFVPQPKVQQSFAHHRGGNCLGLEDVEDNQIVIWLLSRWDDVKIDSVMADARTQFVNAAIHAAKRRGKYSTFVYVNYAAPDQNPLCGYGAENVAFLRGVAQEYDPTGVFQKLMPGGFKISKAHYRRGRPKGFYGDAPDPVIYRI